MLITLRAFSSKWLSTSKAHYELVAVRNRSDRQSMRERSVAKDNCGEVRFIYRLAYNVDGSRSRLPFTTNMVYQVPLSNPSEPLKSCVAAAQKFKTPKSFQSAESYADWLASGPLNLKNLRIQAVGDKLSSRPSNLRSQE